MKKLLESPLDRGAGESSSDATPVSRDDDAVRSNSYNLRKGPSLYRFPRNLESSFDFTGDSMNTTSSMLWSCVFFALIFCILSTSSFLTAVY